MQLNVFTLTNNMYLAFHRHCCAAHDSGENVSVDCLFQAQHYCLTFNRSKKICLEVSVRSEIRFCVICYVMRLTVSQFSCL